MNGIVDLSEAERWIREKAAFPHLNADVPRATRLMAEYDRRGAEIERLGDALAEADQLQQRTDDQIGETRGGVMAAIVAAGLAPHVCDDDDLPDMVRHALTAAKKLAQPALWTYSEDGWVALPRAELGDAENQAGAA